MTYTKCNSCGAELPTLARVCEFCDHVVEQNSGESAADLMSDLEAKLLALKQIEIPGIWSSFKRNSKISMPVLAIASFLLAYKVNEWFAVTGIIFLIYSLISLFRKTKSSPLSGYPMLKSEFDSLLSKVGVLYGNNTEIKSVISRINSEVARIDAAVRKGRRTEMLTYLLIVVILAGLYLLPAQLSQEEKEASAISEDAPVVAKIEAIIASGDIDRAKSMLSEVKSPANQLKLQSEMQLAIREDEMDTITILLNQGDFEDAALKLGGLHWIKICQDYELESIEVEYFKAYIKKKSALNERLPEELKVKVESELDF